MKTTLLLAILLAHAASNHSYADEGYIKVPGGSVWYHIEGTAKKTPLLVIHGGPGGNSCALAPLKKLSKDRQIIFYDQLGGGKSEQPENTALWNIERFIEELAAVRKELGLQKVNILAHSWGAAIAGKYLIDKGTEGVESIIFVGPYLSSYDWLEDVNVLRQQLKPETQAVLKKHEQAGTLSALEYQRATDEFYALFLFRHPRPAPKECLGNGSRWSPAIYNIMWGNSEFMVSGNLKDFNVAKDLHKITIPSLFLVGEYDEARASTIQRYQQRMQQADVIEIKDAAHMSMSDQPEQFVAQINTFLQKVEQQKLKKQSLH